MVQNVFLELSLLVCLSISDAGPSAVHPTYLRLADEFIADADKDLNDLQRDVSTKLGQNIPIVAPGASKKNSGSYAGAAASGAAAGRGDSSSREPAPEGCKWYRGHICCKACGQRVGKTPSHTNQTCPVDTSHAGFRFGSKFPLKTSTSAGGNAASSGVGFKRPAGGAASGSTSGLAPHDLRNRLNGGKPAQSPSSSGQWSSRVVQAHAALEAGQDEFVDEDGNTIFLDRDLRSGELCLTMKIPQNCSPRVESEPLSRRVVAYPSTVILRGSNHPRAPRIRSNHQMLLGSNHPQSRGVSIRSDRLVLGSNHPRRHIDRSACVLANPSTLHTAYGRSNHLPVQSARPVFRRVSAKSQAPKPVQCFAPSYRSSSPRRGPRVIVDTGAEEHMGPPSAAADFKCSTPTNIVIKGVSSSELTGVRKGVLRVSTRDESGAACSLEFSKALIHSDLDFVLLSVHRLLEEGFVVDFQQNGGNIISPLGVVVPLSKCGGLWTISSSPPVTSSSSRGLSSRHSTSIPPSSNPFAALAAKETEDDASDDSSDVTKESADLQRHLDVQQQLAQNLHNRFDHCDRARLVRIVKHMSRHDPTRPSISTCAKFTCPACSTMASRRPAARLANPSRSAPRGFFPGECLHIDCSGSLDQTVTAVCGSVDVFAITDDSSNARFALPTKSATTSALVEALQRFQAKSMVKIRRITCDGALAAGALTTWCLENNIDLAPSPPNEPRSNGRAESLVNLLKTKMRVMRQTSGAGIPFAYLIMSWAAMHSNFLPTSTNPDMRPAIDIWPDMPFRHRDLRHDLPWGCRAWRHEGKDYQNRPNWQRRARPCIFVGWSMSSPSYLLYDIETYRLFEGSYVTFDTNNFPLLDLLLAGETHTADKQVDIDGWRIAANTLIESANDFDLAHWCSGKQLVIELPATFYPRDSPHRWIMQCVGVPHSRKNTGVAITLRTVGFTGPHSAISDPEDKTYVDRPRLFDLVVSGASSSSASLRRALSFTFPTAVKLYDLALQNFTRLPRPPGHPRLLMDDPSSSPGAGVASAGNASSTAKQASTSRPVLPRRTKRPPKTNAEPRRSSPRLQAARRAGMARIAACSIPGRGTHFVSPPVAKDEPANLREARRGPNWPEWEQALKKELDGIAARGTYSTLPRASVPNGNQMLHGLFVFKRKADGTAKVRLVVQGHRQRPMPSTSETFTSTPTQPALRAFYSVANQNDDHIDHIDVHQAFCQSDEFPEEVKLYMVPPPLAEADPNIVWRLRRPLYGLATAPKLWAETLRRALVEQGWSPVAFEDCMWSKVSATGYRMLLYVFVDDILIAYGEADRAEASSWKQTFLQRFDAKDLGPVQRFLGVNIERDFHRGTLKIHQTDYVHDLLERFGLETANPVSTPLTPHINLTKADCPAVPNPALGAKYREAVGALTWLASATRPDLAHATAVLGAFSSNPGEAHWSEVVHCLRYLVNTFDFGITYTRDAANPAPNMQNHMFGFCDSDWAACVDTRRSMGAYLIFLNGGAIAWRSKKQTSIALSTAEAEFMAASATAQTVLWLRRILCDLGAPQHCPTPLYEDNAACILLSENPSHKGRARHIDLHVHSLRDHVLNGVVRLVACPTFDMAADLLTKALPSPAFFRHRDVMMGNAPPTAPALAPVLAFTARLRCVSGG